MATGAGDIVYQARGRGSRGGGRTCCLPSLSSLARFPHLVAPAANQALSPGRLEVANVPLGEGRFRQNILAAALQEIRAWSAISKSTWRLETSTQGARFSTLEGRARDKSSFSPDGVWIGAAQFGGLDRLLSQDRPCLSLLEGISARKYPIKSIGECRQHRADFEQRGPRRCALELINQQKLEANRPCRRQRMRGAGSC